jgi:exodeoxyribonuclease V alpha subunit
MSELSVILRVTSIRSRGKIGGVIFAGTAEDEQHYVAVCDRTLVPDASLVDKGQQWAIQGKVSLREVKAANGFKLKESQIAATSAEMLRPMGRNIIDWIASSPDCPGIGQVKATKLYERFGPGLVDHIESRNVVALTELLSDEAADLLCCAFDKFKVAGTLLWLDQLGIPKGIGASVVAYYKDQAQAKITANPYVLSSFEPKWATVDALARKRFGVNAGDPRRLESAVDEALYRGLQQGHTCLPAKDVQSLLVKLLGSTDQAKKALAMGAENTQYQIVEGYYQSHGAAIIESYVADRLRAMVHGESLVGQAGLCGRPATNPCVVEEAIRDYEHSHAISLSEEQRDAVLTCANANLSLILGGAGTGKTTVLKALYAALEVSQPGIPIFQLALAGRAAQRMAEATGRKSITIAGFLTRVTASEIEMGSVIVVDEMSMVDVILMYRLLRHLPGGVRLILVGDPSQLPPIGPGLVLHALAGLPTIPQVELKVVKRQSSDSGIPQVAGAIRSHQLPSWAEYHGMPGVGVSFIPCKEADLDATVERVYDELGGTGADYGVQILSITNAKAGGVRNLCASLHERYRKGDEVICYFDLEFGLVAATTVDRTLLKVGDLVIFTENDYGLELRNGSLGRVIRPLAVEEPCEPCCVCDFEGVEYTLTASQLEAVSHSYSITVHKSQGSQFSRVIVPVRDSRILDQTLIYTAVTRGVAQVVLIGDKEAAMRAIRAPASAAKRHVTLPALLGLPRRADIRR